MMRPAPSRRAWLCVALLLWLSAGCGGSSSVSVGVPTDNNGPVLSGQVAMPNGRLAAAGSALERFAAAIVARAEALVAANVRPVGAGVEVRLLRIGPGNIQNGTITGGEVVNRATTQSDGVFALRMPTGTDPRTCRFVLEVGNSADRTVTRAFVDATSIDINFESEATVRLLLDEIKAGRVALCDLSASEIFSVRQAVQQSPNQAFGETAAAINASATAAAGSDPTVRSAIDQATGNATPIPEPTNTVPAPTRTNTSSPTRTNTTAPTSTATAVPTNSVGPTNTPLPTSTAVPSATSVPTSTATPVPTTTAVPTSTATAVPTNTPVPTSTAVPTNTATPPPPPTFTATFTATATAVAPKVSLGVVAGTAGFTVDVPIALDASGAAIAAVSADVTFDRDAASVASGASGPDCRIDARLAATKTIVAAVADVGGGLARLRVGVVGLTNNAPIGSGPLGVCRFALAPDASGSIALAVVAEAAGQQAQAIPVDAVDGRIDVSAAPATLALSAGTAAVAVGAAAEVTASLAPSGASLAAVSSEIRFDPTRLSAGDSPDCTLAAAPAAAGKELVARVLPADDLGFVGVRVGVFGRTNNTALPAGAVFSCRFQVESGGAPIPLFHAAEGASPAAEPIGVYGGTGAAITVQ